MSDLMLYGVLRMPYDMAMSSELSRRQFYDRVQEAADRLQAAEAASSPPAVPGDALPPLPEPANKIRFTTGMVHYVALDEGRPYFIADQMQAYARAAVEADRAQRLEHCRWPTCESEAKQDEIAAQAYRELYSGEGGADRAQQGEPVATVRVTNSGYGMELSTYVAYALPEGTHELYAGPVAATKAAAPAIVPQGVAKLLHKLRDEGVLSEGQITQALGVDRLTCREILDGDFVAAAPADAPKSATFEDWLASEIEPPSGDLTPQQRVIAYAKLAFEAGRAAPVPDTGIPKYKDITDHNGKIVGVQLVNWDERPRYDRAPISTTPTSGEVEKAEAAPLDDGKDPLYDKAVMVVRAKNRASISLVQRTFMIGYNRASRLLERMEAEGVVTAFNDEGCREVVAAPSHPSEAQTCTYPKCSCPFDAPCDPTWCARGLACPSEGKAREDA